LPGTPTAPAKRRSGSSPESIAWLTFWNGAMN